MIRIIILALAFSVFSLCAEDILTPKSVYNIANTINLEAEPASLVNNSVNVISGDYCDSQQDLVLPGSHPLTLERAYVSSDWQEGSLYHGWHFNHCGEITIETGDGSHEATWYDSFGGKRSYRGSLFNARLYVPLEIKRECLSKGITNCGLGKIGGRTNLKNSKIYYCKKKDVCFVRMPDKTEKHFEKHGNRFYLCREDTPLEQRFHYTYEKKEHRINSITSTNKAEQVMGKIDLLYEKNHDFKKDRQLEVVTSDGRSVLYNFEKIKHANHGHTGYFLSEVIRPNAPWEKYRYYNHSHQVARKERPDGRFLDIYYYEHGDEKGRVRKLRAPVGVDHKPITTHKFSYELCIGENEKGQKELWGGSTTVLDAVGNKTVYKFSYNQRLADIEKYTANNSLYSIEQLFWYPKEVSQISSKGYFSALDHEWIFFRKYEYDERGNVLQEKLYGNLSGWNVTPLKHCVGSPSGAEEDCRYFGYDGVDRLIAEANQHQQILYTYVGLSELVSSKLTLTNSSVCKREGYWYDDNGVLIREVIDDGYTQDLNNLAGVTERKIRTVVPRQEYPFGLPQIIEEKYLDLATGQEVLLKKTVNSYSPLGHLIRQELYDANNRFVHSYCWEYDDHGNLLKEVDPLGREVLRRYDDNDNLIFEQGTNLSYHKEFTYDFSNRLILEEEVHGDKRLAVRHRYDYLNNRVATIDWYGNETNYLYDEFSRLIQIRYPLVKDETGNLTNPIVQMTYDVMGYVTSKTDPRGYLTKTKNTIRGQPALVEYPDGSKEITIYTLEGQIKQTTARNGLTQKYTYDYQFRPIKTECYSLSGELISTQYCTYNAFHLTSETDGKGNVTLYSYDGAGRLKEKIKGKERSVHYYDALGRIHQTWEYTSETEYSVQTWEYDLLDRVIEERTEDASGKVLRRQGYAYDGDGNRSVIIQYTQTGMAMTSIVYDSHKQPILVTDPLGKVTQTIISYNLNHPYRETIDPMGNITAIASDAMGRIVTVEKKNSLGTIIQKADFTYDLTSNQVGRAETVFFQKNQRLVVTAWEFDEMNREIHRIEAKGSIEQKSLVTKYNTLGQKDYTIKPNGVVISYTYDVLGRMSGVSSSDGTISYSYIYDANHNLLQAFDHIGHTKTQKLYDGNDRLIEEILGNALSVGYAYDGKGRPVAITLPDKTSVSYTYNAAGLESVSRSGKRYTYSYDQAGYLGSIQTSHGLIKYEYDIAGRVIQIQAPHFCEKLSYDRVGNVLKTIVSSSIKTKSASYAYDDLYQLKEEPGYTYVHDSLYNRLAKNSETYFPNALNLLGHPQLTYDQCGNMIVQNKNKYSYDAWDRLTCVKTPAGTFRYEYDAQNRRLCKKTYSLEGNLISTVRYLYLGENEVGAVDEQNQFIEFRVLGAGKGAEIGASIHLELKGETYLPIHDHNGNISALLDHSGNLVEHYSFSSFGEEESSQTQINPWRFASKRCDPETGLIYFGRRYYAPTLGRWITQDPLGFQAGPNLYSYVENNPLNNIDPYGLSHRKHSIFCTILHYAGHIIKAIGDHLIPIPIVRDVVSFVGHLLVRRTLNHFDPSSRNPHSGNFFTINMPITDKASLHMVNGMLCSKKNTENAAWEMSADFGGTRVNFTYNATHGFIEDLFECIVQRLGFCTNSVKQLVHSIRQQIAEKGGVDSGHIVELFAHSQGGIMLDQALKYLSAEEKKMLRISTFGSGKMISSEGVASAVNYVSKRDAIPFIADPLGHLMGLFSKNMNIQYLDSKGSYFIDHPLRNETYWNVVKRLGNDFINKYVSLQ